MTGTKVTGIYVVGDPDISKDKPFRYTVRVGDQVTTHCFRTRQEAEHAYPANEVLTSGKALPLEER